jgi:hypothetical protein
VYISISFSWDIDKGNELLEKWKQVHNNVLLGGPAFGNHDAIFEAGKYMMPGVTITSRGCNNSCKWCLVKEREGNLREIHNFPPGHIVQDNNLLQCSKGHIKKVFRMLRYQKLCRLVGGLQADLLHDWIIDEIKHLDHIDYIFLAADTKHSLVRLARAMEKLRFLRRQQKKVYVMCGYKGETIDEAEERCQEVWKIGGTPYVQLYQPPEKDKIIYGKDWNNFRIRWGNPILLYQRQKLMDKMYA